MLQRDTISIHGDIELDVRSIIIFLVKGLEFGYKSVAIDCECIYIHGMNCASGNSNRICHSEKVYILTTLKVHSTDHALNILH